jgi:hypothetical protein
VEAAASRQMRSSPPRRRGRSLRTTSRSATRPNPSHPMHRHHIDASEIAIVRESDAVAVATRHKERCLPCVRSRLLPGERSSGAVGAPTSAVSRGKRSAVSARSW